MSHDVGNAPKNVDVQRDECRRPVRHQWREARPTLDAQHLYAHARDVHEQGGVSDKQEERPTRLERLEVTPLDGEHHHSEGGGTEHSEEGDEEPGGNLKPWVTWRDDGGACRNKTKREVVGNRVRVLVIG